MTYKSFHRSKPETHSAGQILISILIALAVFSILIHTIFTLIRSSFELVGLNRSRVTARHLAQGKMEIIRNMGYDEIGTEGGVPPGEIPQTETIEKNNIEFVIKTDISYIDDPFNGVSALDTDYKRIRVEVSWIGLNEQKNNPVVLITDISPEASASSSGGAFKILVFDANGNPLPDATVRIVASSVDPPIDLTLQTNSDGEVNRQGMPPCNNCYEITVTKEGGYSTDRTYSSTEVTNPYKPHASIIEGELTQISFSIDRIGSINVASVDGRGNDFVQIGGIPFRIRGEKIIGTDSTGKSVYKFDQQVSTDGSGIYNFDEMEWDIYYLLMPESTSYDISGSNPIIPLNLLPQGIIDITFAVEPHTDHSLLTIVKDESQVLLEEVYLRLYDDFGFEESTTSGKVDNPDFGQALFSNLDETITYHLEATASGYLNVNRDVFVSGYTTDEIIMKK